MPGSLATDARRLDAPEGRALICSNSGIDANNTKFERFAHTPSTCQIAREEVGSKPEFGIVCQSYYFLFLSKVEDRRDRTECLFARDAHLRRGVGQNCRLVESSAEP